MGKNNRQRRAAKKRQRQRVAGGRPSTDRRAASRCECDACRGERLGSQFEAAARERESSERTNADRFAEMEEVIPAALLMAWNGGWQPAEVVRQIRRTVAPASVAAELVCVAVVVGHSRHDVSEVHQAWQRQVDAVGRRVAGEADSGWAARWASRQASEETALSVFVDVTSALSKLGRLPKLIPPPGGCADPAVDWLGANGTDTFGSGAVRGEHADPMLAKIRSLLAKAEATDFPSEAEAFTAKAYDMMLKHSVDEAVLRARENDDVNGRGRAVAIRLPVDEPYAKQHALLLAVVADVSGCQAVFHPESAMSTVMGPASAVHRSELLYTSLMVQAQRALAVEGSASDSGSLRRSRGFKSAFLTGFAHRVGDRLDERRRAASDDVPGSALPVLASDAVATERLAEELFGGATRSMSSGRINAAGYESGDAAGGRAQLDDSAVTGGSNALP